MLLKAICPEYDISTSMDVQYIPAHTLANPINYLKGTAECSLVSKGHSCPNSNQCPLYLAAPHKTSSPYVTMDLCK